MSGRTTFIKPGTEHDLCRCGHERHEHWWGGDCGATFKNGNPCRCRYFRDRPGATHDRRDGGLMEPKQNVQVAPYPHELADLVAKCAYRRHEGWRIELVDDCERDKDAEDRVVGRGLTLSVLTDGYDTYHPERGRGYHVYHYFIVPAATYNRASWQRWLFEQLLRVETHECMENFVITTDVCGHCGKPDEPNGAHSCDCPGTIATGCGHEFDRDVRHERPFAPLHGKGDDPYVVHEYATTAQRDTRFTDVAPA